MGKNGTKNLIPTNKRTKEEARELGRKGGKASGVARAKKKAMREWAEMFRDLEIDVNTPDGKKLATTFAGASVFGQFQKAITEKDTRAAKFLAELLGEMETNINVKDVTPQVVVSNPKTAEQLKKVLNADNEDI